MSQISQLWHSGSEEYWQDALAKYWQHVKPANEVLERKLERLQREELWRLNEEEWYDFLHDQYFKWKYTAPNRYATTKAALEKSNSPHGLANLFHIKRQLLTLSPDNIHQALKTAMAIPGLGVSGASGLLSLMYPESFGTADQFVVKGLQSILGIPEYASLMNMNPENLSLSDAVLLIEIMRRKAAENNERFDSRAWTPRKIDMVLWGLRDPASD